MLENTIVGFIFFMTFIISKTENKRRSLFKYIIARLQLFLHYFQLQPIFFDGKLPQTVSKSEVPVDWDHFHVLLEGILNRVPSMGDAVLERLTNGPESFSPDGNWVLGQAPEVK